jgi:predicted Zn-dependent peptidase
VLGGGLSSRLFEEIREKRGLVYSVFSGIGLYSDVGAYSIAAGTQPKHADEVLHLIRLELRRLVADGITDDELDVARGYLTGSFELGLEDTASRMARNGGSLCTRGAVVDVAEQVRRWNAVSLDDTRRVIERVFATEPLVVTVGPAE